jgi:RNA polymerase sigma-70 factor (ECF subfamily)
VILSDAELVRAAQGGDAAGLGVLLERHRASLYALALGFTGHGPEAQDAVQDTFLIALREIDRLREPAAVSGWLHTILRNLCLTRLRKRQVEVPFEGPIESFGFSEPSAERYIDQLSLREWVWTALAELPEVLRVTAILRYFGSYATYEELSVILGIPIGTVRSRLSQVKVKLAEALLETAGLAHEEARQLSAARIRFFTEAHTEFNRGESYEMLASAFSDDVVLTIRGGTVDHGLDFLVHKVWEENMEVGVKMHPTNILASKDVTVVEGTFENPSDDPFHCPPATSMVLLYHDQRINRFRQYYAPHPQRGRNNPA